MAIGARAVIAAGWPVGDAAAEAFAATFYRHFLDGVSFSGAVAAGRHAAFAVGGRETWAAYQCYGDPELVLDGSSSRATVDEGEPVSVDDLLRRLKSLEVRASDLGRPGAGRLDRRRDQLITSFDRYAEWAESHGVLAPEVPSSDEQRAASAVQRQLAKLAAELGQFRHAARRYLSLVSPPQSGTRRQPGRSAGGGRTSRICSRHRTASPVPRSTTRGWTPPATDRDDAGRRAAAGRRSRPVGGGHHGRVGELRHPRGRPEAPRHDRAGRSRRADPSGCRRLRTSTRRRRRTCSPVPPIRAVPARRTPAAETISTTTMTTASTPDSPPPSWRCSSTRSSRSRPSPTPRSLVVEHTDRRPGALTCRLLERRCCGRPAADRGCSPDARATSRRRSRRR